MWNQQGQLIWNGTKINDAFTGYEIKYEKDGNASNYFHQNKVIDQLNSKF